MLSPRRQIQAAVLLASALAISNAHALCKQLIYAYDGFRSRSTRESPTAALEPLQSALGGESPIGFISKKSGIEYFRDLMAAKYVAAPRRVEEAAGHSVLIATGYTRQELATLAQERPFDILIGTDRRAYVLKYRDP
ncbi:MAG: hypothetical protein JO317_04650 [Verrucomicrobiae bacterium]|nr:hypothetical protein [Verrucomicrobiae bacterium]